MQIDLEQGTPEWHEFRAGGLGASDAPIVMGASPWKTPQELFLEKIGKKKPKKGASPAMQRGITLEPVARSYYELRSGMDFIPTIFQDPELPFLFASLDGWNAEFRIDLEIKCPNLKDHILAKRGFIPEKYVYQLQHQIMVSGAVRCDYFSFDGSRGVVVNVKPDLELIKKMRDCEIKFMECVRNKHWVEYL